MSRLVATRLLPVLSAASGRRGAGSFLVACLIILQLLASILIDKVDGAPKIFNSVYMATTIHAEFAAMMKKHPTTVLLGDSHAATLGKAPGGANYGAQDIMVAQVAGTMPQNIHEASAIVLVIGTNDIWRGEAAGLLQRLQDLAFALPKSVPLVWSGIPPGDDLRLHMVDIQAANELIRTLCAARANCVYVDTWKLLADDKGEPDHDLLLADNVHLSANGYRRWLGALDTALDAIAP